MVEVWGGASLKQTNGEASNSVEKRDCGGVTVFFFSSRRRHTRCSRDWSSDVCSSDLVLPGKVEWACKKMKRTDYQNNLQTMDDMNNRKSGAGKMAAGLGVGMAALATAADRKSVV